VPLENFETVEPTRIRLSSEFILHLIKTVLCTSLRQSFPTHARIDLLVRMGCSYSAYPAARNNYPNRSALAIRVQREVGVLLFRPSSGPIARLPASRQRALHRVTVNGSNVVHWHERLHPELDVVAIYRSFNRS
jgi:hypothetical protein